jgi:hypothetical protein
MADEDTATMEQELNQQEVEEQPQGTEEGAAPKETDELKSALAELTKTVQTGFAKPKEEGKEAELTEEQKEEFWAIYNPEKSQKDFFKKWFRLNPEATQEELDEVKALWADAQKGLVRQAVVGSRNITMSEIEKLRAELKPALDYYSTAKAAETRTRFYDSYPSLKDEKYEKVVAATARTLADKSYDTEEEYFKDLAEKSAEAIKGLIPTFDLGAKPKQKPTGTTPRVPRTSVGGTGGTGAGTGQGGPKKTGSGDIDSLD